MAWYYYLAAYCRDKYTASCMAQKYAGQTFVFSGDGGMIRSSEVCRFYTDVLHLGNDWWLHITPSGITDSGISNEQEALRADEFCNVMYGMLKNDKYFSYAIIGVEVEQFCLLEEMKKNLINMDTPLDYLNGLVISNVMLGNSNKSLLFQDFSNTHKWIPKKSEILRFRNKQGNCNTEGV